MQDVTLSLRGDLDMRHPKFNASRAQQACVSLQSGPLKITGTQVRSSHRTKFEKRWSHVSLRLRFIYMWLTLAVHHATSCDFWMKALSLEKTWKDHDSNSPGKLGSETAAQKL